MTKREAGRGEGDAARMLPRLLVAATLIGLLAPPTVADACPICASETGAEVRAGIFNEDFGWNLLVTVLPFPLMLGIAAALHFGFAPRERGEGEGVGGSSPPTSAGAR